jgi:hypothetical protein
MYKHIKENHHKVPERISKVYFSKVFNTVTKVVQKPKYKEENDLEVRKEILTTVHSKGHFSINSMVAEIHRNYNLHWKGIYNDCSQVVMNCDKCASYNIREEGFLPSRQTIYKFPLDQIAFDVCHPGISTKEGNNCILVVVDYCTRFIWLRPMADETSESIAKQLLDIFLNYGFPKCVKSDNAKNNKSGFLKELLEKVEIITSNSVPYLPKTNGVVERSIQTVMKVLKKQLEQNRLEEWDNYLNFISYFINNKFTRVNRSIPFELMFGRSTNRWVDYSGEDDKETTEEEMSLMEKNFKNRLDLIAKYIYPNIFRLVKKGQDETMEKAVNKDILMKFKIGDLVYVKNVYFTNYKTKNIQGKFKEVYSGPWIIQS